MKWIVFGLVALLFSCTTYHTNLEGTRGYDLAKLSEKVGYYQLEIDDVNQVSYRSKELKKLSKILVNGGEEAEVKEVFPLNMKLQEIARESRRLRLTKEEISHMLTGTTE